MTQCALEILKVCNILFNYTITSALTVKSTTDHVKTNVKNALKKVILFLNYVYIKHVCI